MARALAVLSCSGLALVAAQLAAPTNVSVRTDVAVYRWMNGVVQVDWVAPSFPVVSYRVAVTPLDYTHALTADADIADFVTDAGSARNTIAVSNGALELHFSGSDAAGRSVGRGTAPMAYRRVPLSGLGGTASYSFVTVDVDCSGAPVNASEAMCGLAVFNSATNLPVFTWGLVIAGG